MVCVSTFTVRGGVFIGMNGTSTDLEKLVWCQVVARWTSHVADRLSGAASTNFRHRLGLLVLVLTRVLEATGQTVIKHGRSALGPF
jgi:hypothetical protein